VGWVERRLIAKRPTAPAWAVGEPHDRVIVRRTLRRIADLPPFGGASQGNRNADDRKGVRFVCVMVDVPHSARGQVRRRVGGGDVCAS
jgi:hypothetical protein